MQIANLHLHPERLILDKGGKDYWGKSKSFWTAFITCSIKATFTKWHLSLQTLSTLKFKDTIRRRQNSSTETLFIAPLFCDTKQYLTGLFLLLNMSRPNTSVVPVLGVVPSHKGHLSHSSMESSKHRGFGWLQALTVRWELKMLPQWLVTYSWSRMEWGCMKINKTHR